MDSHAAKAPIILRDSSADSVVKWIRDEFTELDKSVKVAAAKTLRSYGTLTGG
jgi:hypothetical protein